MLVLAFGLLGFLVGPLFGIVVDRAVERERPQPLHRCQKCDASLGAPSLVPVLGWFRRCPVDASHASWRYPLVDVLTALAMGSAVWRFGWNWPLSPYLGLFILLGVAAVIDIETHLLLNILTFPAFAAGLFAVLMLSLAHDRPDAIWPALVGAMVFGGVIFGAFLAYPPGMGLGDAKLAPTLGLFLGWLGGTPLQATRYSLYALLIGLMGTACLALGLRAARVLGPKAEVPMGPGLALGTIAVILAG